MLVRGSPRDCGSLWKCWRPDGTLQRRPESCFFLSLLAGLSETFGSPSLDAHFVDVVSATIDMMDGAGRRGSVDMLDPVCVGLVEAVAEEIQVRIVVLSAHSRKLAPDGTLAFQMDPAINSFYAVYGSGSRTVYLLYYGDGKSRYGHYRLLSRCKCE
jgi:hypothetical protein